MSIFGERSAKKGWMPLDKLITSITESLIDANRKMLELHEDQVAFFIKDASVELSFELHNSEEKSSPHIRLPFVGRRTDENFSESDLCKVRFSLGKLLVNANRPTASAGDASSVTSSRADH